MHGYKETCSNELEVRCCIWLPVYISHQVFVLLMQDGIPKEGDSGDMEEIIIWNVFRAYEERFQRTGILQIKIC